MSSHGIVNIHVCIISCHGIDEICIHAMDFDGRTYTCHVVTFVSC